MIGPVGCGVLESCQFDGDVFVGCCDTWEMLVHLKLPYWEFKLTWLYNSCTGQVTRITIQTPYSTITFVSGSAVTLSTGLTTSSPSSVSLPTSASAAQTSSSSSSTLSVSLPISTATEGSSTNTATSTSVVSSAAVSTTSSSSTRTSSANRAHTITSFLNGNLEVGLLVISILLII